MVVYAAFYGEYEEPFPIGVYDSLEKAKSAVERTYLVRPLAALTVTHRLPVLCAVRLPYYLSNEISSKVTE